MGNALKKRAMWVRYIFMVEMWDKAAALSSHPDLPKSGLKTAGPATTAMPDRVSCAA
jgi:hypothetical protein